MSSQLPTFFKANWNTVVGLQVNNLCDVFKQIVLVFSSICIFRLKCTRQVQTEGWRVRGSKCGRYPLNAGELADVFWCNKN